MVGPPDGAAVSPSTAAASVTHASTLINWSTTVTSDPVDAAAGSTVVTQEQFVLTVTFVALGVLLVIIFVGLVMIILPPIRCIQTCCACKCIPRQTTQNQATEAPPPEDVWI